MVERLVKLLTRRCIHVVAGRILTMGLTFKENCPDIRNTRVVDMIKELRSYQASVDVYDPWANADEVKAAYTIETV